MTRPDESKTYEGEFQEGEAKSIAKQEKLKKIVKRHPIRDTPKVDSVEVESSKSIKPDDA